MLSTRIFSHAIPSISANCLIYLFSFKILLGESIAMLKITDCEMLGQCIRQDFIHINRDASAHVRPPVEQDSS
jgi:hypothetical protein